MVQKPDAPMHQPIRCLVRHHVPGRTRLGILGPWPVRWDGISGALAEAGIILARAEPLTGGILLRHPPAIGADALTRALTALLEGRPLPAELDPAPAPDAVPAPRSALPAKARIVARAGQTCGAPNAQAMSDPDLDQVFLLEAPQVLARFGTSPDGLTEDAAEQIRARLGANVMPQPAGRSRREMLLEQVTNLPVGLLAGSAALSFATGGVFDAVVTLTVIAVNAGIGFATENSTENLIRRLSRPVEHPVAALRAGTPITLASREVVVGDVVLLSPGTVVPADARLIASNLLSVDESALTGESLPVEKTASPLPVVPKAVAERHNLVHAGTVVTGGDGLAVVVRTGTQSEAARTRTLIGDTRPPRPVTEEKLAALSSKLAIGCLGASGVLLSVSLARSEPFIAAVRSAIALAVAAIPEGLPAVATTTLALGAKAMEKDRAFVRSLPAIEAIGAVDTICLDKTGTLTRNDMAVVRVLAGDTRRDVTPGDPVEIDAEGDVRAVSEAVALCSEAELDPRSGSATELALLDFAAASGCDVSGLRATLPLHALRNRDHRHRFMVSEHDGGEDGARLFVKGSPEDVIARCIAERVAGADRPLTDERRAALLAENDRFAGEGLRVLAAAAGRGSLGETSPHDLTFLGLAGLADPIKREAAEAIDLFHKAGIRTIMMTGDQQGTALAVAHELALSRTGVLRMSSGPEIAHLDADALAACRTDHLEF